MSTRLTVLSVASFLLVCADAHSLGKIVPYIENVTSRKFSSSVILFFSSSLVVKFITTLPEE